jgi:alcohol dehydrogenase class IV
MAMCSLLGGMALANAKLGAVHGLAGVIGGTAAVPHGVACAALLAPVIEANIRALGSAQAGHAAHAALGRYADVARVLTGNPAAAVEDGLAWIRETVALLEIPRLAAFGVSPQDAEDVAINAAGSSSMQGNPVALSRDDLRTILLQAI